MPAQFFDLCPILRNWKHVRLRSKAAMQTKAACSFIQPQSGKGGLLNREGADMAEARHVLARLQPEHGFTIHGNDLPQNDKQNGWLAADAWCRRGRPSDCREQPRRLERERRLGVTQGCIEQIIGADGKGEEAIIERHRQAFADEDRQLDYLVKWNPRDSAKADLATWCDVAGAVFNAAMAHALGDLADKASSDNLAISLSKVVDTSRLKKRIRQLLDADGKERVRVPLDARFIEELKSSECMPQELKSA